MRSAILSPMQLVPCERNVALCCDKSKVNIIPPQLGSRQADIDRTPDPIKRGEHPSPGVEIEP